MTQPRPWSPPRHVAGTIAAGDLRCAAKPLSRSTAVVARAVLRHLERCCGSATQARRSFQPPGISLKREMEVLRGLQAENDDFEDAPWRPMSKRREREVHGANATSRTPRRQRCAGAALRSPSWQLSQTKDGGDTCPTRRELHERSHHSWRELKR